MAGLRRNEPLYTNNTETDLNGGITAVATSITVTDGTVFDTDINSSLGRYQLATLYNGTQIEIVKITDVTGNVLTVVREQEGTTGFAFADATPIYARATAGIYDSFLHVDNGGNSGGVDSLTIQKSRADNTQVAGGTDSIAIGNDSKCTDPDSVSIGNRATTLTDSAVAIGVDTDVYEYATASTWAATTAYTVGNFIKFASGNIGICRKSGTSGGTSPTGVVGDFVVDSTTCWTIVNDNTSTYNHEVAIGDNSQGRGQETVSMGWNASASGDAAISIGSGSDAHGERNVAIGGVTTYGKNNVRIGTGGSTPVGRTVAYHVAVGHANYTPVSYATQLTGPDYLPLEDEPTYFGYYGGSNTPDEHLYSQCTERTFFSPPVCAGDVAWQASTAYSMGDCVVPTGAATGYSYYATTWDSTSSNTYYSTSGTSGGTEPTWGGTPTAGETITDNEIIWVCVDLSNIRVTLPENLRLIPTEVGFIGTDQTASATTQPYLSWGINTDTDFYKTSAQTTLLTAAYTRESHAFGAFANTAGSRALAAQVVTVGDGATCGRFYWKGMVVETLET